MRLRFFSSFIQKTQPHCVNCVHYKSYKYTYPQDELYDRVKQLGTCSFFGKYHMVTGEFEPDYALSARQDESKCGKEGRYYKKDI